MITGGNTPDRKQNSYNNKQNYEGSKDWSRTKYKDSCGDGHRSKSLNGSKCNYGYRSKKLSYSHENTVSRSHS